MHKRNGEGNVRENKGLHVLRNFRRDTLEANLAEKDGSKINKDGIILI